MSTMSPAARPPLFTLAFLACAVVAPSPADAGAPPAFPGAEGFGAVATGGRGGSVQRVTTLDATGPGSLQAALDAPGPRIVVFRVSGVIEGDLSIPHGDVTIAGQTAPGAGITIHGSLTTPFGTPVSNIVIRHLRVRPPDPTGNPSQHDAIQFSTADTLILDHVDASHGADEIIDLWDGAHDVTIQWSAITYPIYDPSRGLDHNKGILNHRSCIDSASCDPGDQLGGRISIHHNFFAHARNRTPALSTGPADVVNNVVYNGREGFVHHNIVGAHAADATTVGEFNLIGNWYIEGPSISLAPFWFDPENGTPPAIPTAYYLQDNWVEDPGDFDGRVDDPWSNVDFQNAYTFHCCGVVEGQFAAVVPYDFSGSPGYVPLTVDDGETLLDTVLPRVGAFPRDVVNRWAVEDVTTRTGEWGNRRPADWLDGLTPGTPPVDADADGMPDDWEDCRGFDSTDPNDHSTVLPSGYTAIETWTHEVADALAGVGLFADGFEGGSTGCWNG